MNKMMLACREMAMNQQVLYKVSSLELRPCKANKSDFLGSYDELQLCAKIR